MLTTYFRTHTFGPPECTYYFDAYLSIFGLKSTQHVEKSINCVVKVSNGICPKTAVSTDKFLTPRLYGELYLSQQTSQIILPTQWLFSFVSGRDSLNKRAVTLAQLLFFKQSLTISTFLNRIYHFKKKQKAFNVETKITLSYLGTNKGVYLQKKNFSS